MADPKHSGPGRRVHLAPRQLQIALLTADGLSAKEIAALLDISAGTVEIQRSLIYQTVQVKNAVMLTRWLIREGLLEP